ncbi:MAG TPA: NADH-quinone oxidoreductase subunit N [Thermoanaerobaculia bacterium]|nr:NADH-quinone oxidoreductase subunit N [Thermoanaerobaculia bacterium]HUM29543.1 NADH-quinone oxidoreductase subunit N [Thermoanaerobaculia bacterium]HXK67926.1 NADH-quinone oxidoreductase subunit N [Thermoanaerobaculia bacterium]
MNTDILALLPQLCLTAGGLILLLTALIRKEPKGPGILIAFLTLFASMGALVMTAEGGARTAFAGMLTIDGFGLFFSGLCIAGSILTLLLSLEYIKEGGWGIIEYSAILIFATAGMVFMVTSLNLVSIYVGLELMALSSYVLASFCRNQEKSFEAGFKYFLLGAFSSGLLLYGLSLIYGATGSLDIAVLASSIQRAEPMLVAGLALTASGLLFKVAAVPFHVWTPDVYEGAPTPVTAFFAIGPKAAAFAVLLRVFAVGLGPLHQEWSTLIGLSAALTMVFGNLVALVQKNIKRMLAYSSIAHAGYALLGLLAFSELGIKAVLIYMLAYLFMTAGAFALVIFLKSRTYAGEMIEDFRGLNHTHPFLSFCMLVFMLSLAGIPPTAGFIGKLFLFAAAIQAGYVILAVLGVLMSAVSLYYYLGPIVAMYQRDETMQLPLRRHWSLSTAVVICLVGTLLVGLMPNWVIEVLSSALLPVV